MVAGKVIGRKCDLEGNPIGMANENPILDTRVYKGRLWTVARQSSERMSLWKICMPSVTLMAINTC